MRAFASWGSQRSPIRNIFLRVAKILELPPPEVDPS